MHSTRPWCFAFVLAACGGPTHAEEPTAAETTTAAVEAATASDPAPHAEETDAEEIGAPETDRPAAPPIALESVLEAFAPDAVAPAEANRVRAFLRAQLHGEVTVIGGVPGDDAGVLATVRVPAPHDAAEGEGLDRCGRTRLERVVADSTGAMRVEGDLRGVCPSASGEGAQQGDVDGDGRLELVFTSTLVEYTSEDSRSGPGVPAGTVRRAVITDTSLRPQAEVVLSERYEDTEGGEPDSSSLTRVTLVDEDGDGLRDLGLDTRRFSYLCEARDPWSVPEDDETCYPEDSHAIRRYDASSDAWPAP